MELKGLGVASGVVGSHPLVANLQNSLAPGTRNRKQGLIPSFPLAEEASKARLDATEETRSGIAEGWMGFALASK